MSHRTSYPRRRFERMARSTKALALASGLSLGLGLGLGLVTVAPTAAGAQSNPGSGSTPPPNPPPTPAPPQAYSLLDAGGRLIGYGGGFSAVVPAPTSPVVGVASTSDGHGAYAAETNGSVIALGDAVDQGSMSGKRLNQPIVGIAVDPATNGYWLVASDGGLFSYGGAHFYGSTGNVHLNQPIVGMAPTPTGHGYWMVASDGGIFSFGDAHFYGSTGNVHLNQPIIAMSPTRSGHGYWMVASDGGIFTYGDAPFYGSGAGQGTRVVGMATGVGDNYDDPLRAVSGLISMRVDEGVDYGGSGPVYALGDGVVISTTGSWPGGAFIAYKLTNGPAIGKIVYVAENLTPTVKIGQSVTPNTVVGILHNAYPDMETGWAADQWGDTMAAMAGQWTSSDDANSLPTAFGVNFNQLLVSLGAPSGVLEHPTVTGTLPKGWPVW